MTLCSSVCRLMATAQAQATPPGTAMLSSQPGARTGSPASATAPWMSSTPPQPSGQSVCACVCLPCLSVCVCVCVSFGDHHLSSQPSGRCVCPALPVCMCGCLSEVSNATTALWSVCLCLCNRPALSVCLPACLPSCLPVCLYSCLSVFLLEIHTSHHNPLVCLSLLACLSVCATEGYISCRYS